MIAAVGRRPAVALAVVGILLGACSDDAAAPTTTIRAATTVAPATTTTTTIAPTTTSTVSPTTSTTTATTTTVVEPRATIADLLGLGRPIVLAHTGGEDEFPGSTMFAYGESVKADVDMLDLNVQLSHDGALVIHHDDAVDRTTNGTGKVADLDLAALQQLDDAYWFTASCVCTGRPESDYVYRGIRTGQKPPPPGYTADDFAIPTLRQLIERYPDIPLNIEVEGDGQRAIDAATELIKELTELGRLDATVISSFDDATVAAVRQLAPSVETSPGLTASAAWVLNGTPLPAGQRILQLPPTYNEIQVLTPDVITRSHAAGYVIWVWPNEQEDADLYAELLAMGLDGLNINFPATGVAAVKAFVEDK
jgi:glycerophosphoryl diester phosphodiesterase